MIYWCGFIFTFVGMFAWLISIACRSKHSMRPIEYLYLGFIILGVSWMWPFVMIMVGIWLIGWLPFVIGNHLRNRGTQ